jgi:hypothetical protein
LFVADGVLLQNDLDERRATTCPVGRQRVAGLI